MTRHVRGILFVDYVRIIRAFKEVAWKNHLPDEDIVWLSQEIDRREWYPMESYERMGLAILDRIAGGSFALIRRWGRETARALHQANPRVVVEGDPRETLTRFDGLRGALFDFPAFALSSLREGEALFEIDYGMGPRAEEAGCQQSVGVIEQLLELAGAEKVIVEPISRSWAGADTTVIRAKWSPRW